MRVLFVKTSSLGDVIHNCPAVSDVARAHPGCEIDWVVEEGFAPIAAHHRDVRRVIPVAWRRWRRSLWRGAVWSEIGRFREALTRDRYDVVIDTQGLLKSALLARQADGIRHGYDRDSAREPVAARLYDRVHRVPVELHAVERNRALAAASLGDGAGGACDYRLVFDSSLDVPGLRPPYCVLLTMTSREHKLWSEPYWIDVMRVAAAQGMQSVLPWGSTAERERARRLADAVPGSVVPDRLAVDALGTLLIGARAAIGVDTGLTHLACAVGTPTVGIYTATEPGLTGLYGAARIANCHGPRPADVAAALDIVLR